MKHITCNACIHKDMQRFLRAHANKTKNWLIEFKERSALQTGFMELGHSLKIDPPRVEFKDPFLFKIPNLRLYV